MALNLTSGYKSTVTVDFEKNFNEQNEEKKAKKIYFDTCELSSSQTIIDSATISGTRNSQEPGFGHIDSQGSMTVPVDSTTFPIFLKAMFDAPNTTDNEDGTFIHTFKVGDNQPSMTIDKGFGNGKHFIYTGCKVGGCSCTFGDDGILNADISVIGCNEEIQNEPYDADATQLPLNRFNNFNVTLKFDDVAVGNVQTMDWSYEGGLDDSIYTLGNKFRSLIPEGMISVSGTLHALFTDTELLEKAIAGTPIKMELLLENSQGHTMSILMNEVNIQRNSPQISGPAGVTYDIEYKAFMRDSDSSVVITVINETAEY